MRSLYINTTVSLSFVMKTENNIEQRICTLPSGKHTQRKSYLTSCPLKLTIIFSGSLNRTCTGSKTLRRFINFNERAKSQREKIVFLFVVFFPWQPIGRVLGHCQNGLRAATNRSLCGLFNIVNFRWVITYKWLH